MVRLGNHGLDGKAKDAFLARLDNLLPAQSISTTQYATMKRVFRGPTGKPVRWSLKKTPYAGGVQDALDMPGVRQVALQASARFMKTVAGENKVMKHWTFGPSYNVIWYMQTKDDLADYVDERFDWMLENHPEVAEKIDPNDSRNGRFRKQIGESLLLMRPATLRTTRGKAAPIIIVDEMDAYDKRVRNAIRGLIRNRQREFGANAIAYFCSHPDAGLDGVAGIIVDGLKHLWWWQCPKCLKSSSPCQGAEHRMQWNVPVLLGKAEDLEHEALLDMIEKEARLICPHCRAGIEEKMRLPMSNAGSWLQPHQKLNQDGTITGKPRVAEIMGFVGHGFMSPFVNLGKLAREWAAAWLKANGGGDDIALREETVKSLGELYGGADAGTHIDDWKVVQTRLTRAYNMKTVPPGVLFLTAFVDVQGDRYEVRVIGWDLMSRSWLIDAYPVKQWPGFDNIDPTNRIRDWDIIEDAVLNQVYPLASTMDFVDGRYVVTEKTLYLPIAKTLLNAAGAAGEVTNVTWNARIWMANLIDPDRPQRLAEQGLAPRPAVEIWRVQLYIGSASATSGLYGKPRPVIWDDQAKKLDIEVEVLERAINVFELKKLIARRMKIDLPAAPGSMNLPHGLPPRYVRELVAEKLVNDVWVRSGANETWDGWVACEAARALLQPDREGLWVQLPEWAEPRPRDAFEVRIDVETTINYYDRLADLNRS
jgi:phage terminase large subunit GpA-like protein